MECIELDVFEPIFDTGDDERCPMCGTPLLVPMQVIKCEGVVSYVYRCGCGRTITVDYEVYRITVERE